MEALSTSCVFPLWLETTFYIYAEQDLKLGRDLGSHDCEKLKFYFLLSSGL